MLCPACETDLKMSDRQGVEIDYCPKCRGVWLDRGELDKIIERSVQADSPSKPSSVLGTPASSYEKRKNDYVDVDDDSGEFYRSSDRRDDRDDRRGDPDDRHDPRRKKKSFLGDMFDIFD